VDTMKLSVNGEKTEPCLRSACCTQAKVHPEQPANSIDRETFDTLWEHSVDLLQRG